MAELLLQENADASICDEVFKYLDSEMNVTSGGTVVLRRHNTVAYLCTCTTTLAFLREQ